jgi:hypothetical protein
MVHAAEARLRIYFRQRFIQRSGERREIIAHRRPHDVEINAEISVNEAVAHGNDFRKRNCGKLRAHLWLIFEPASPKGGKVRSVMPGGHFQTL